ncbi:protein unc-93 homolog A-like isoform X2 [Ptychodera flava]|uniref:protein unc-93 homolog A-like isoform X2 n=1 Tax=Ptychodera flava TaxID=63121 RepID=UPI00396A2CFA
MDRYVRTFGEESDIDAMDFFIANEESEYLILDEKSDERDKERDFNLQPDARCGDIRESKETYLKQDKVERRIWRNLLLLGVAFFVTFTAHDTYQSLQNVTDCNFGFSSLIVTHLSVIISALILPNIVLRLVGIKWTVIGCISCYIIYTLANVHPQWYTVIPVSVLDGVVGAPLWTSEGTYISTSAFLFAEATDETPDGVLGKFFGTFSAVYNLAGIISGIVSSVVYEKTLSNSDQGQEFGQAGIAKTCGANFCWARETMYNTTAVQCSSVPLSTTAILVVTFAILSIMSVLLVVFLVDKLPGDKTASDTPCLSTTFATVHLWKDYRLWMLVPIIFSGGLRTGIITLDFAKSYVSCGIGVEYIGYVSMANSIALVIAAFLTGRLAERIGRISQLVFGMACDFALIIVMLVWQPGDLKSVYFFVSAAWGVTDALIFVHIRSFVGILFPETLPAAFANFYLWTSLGTVVSFAMSLILCPAAKLCILMAIQLVALALYIAMEYFHYKQKGRKSLREWNRCHAWTIEF